MKFSSIPLGLALAATLALASSHAAAASAELRALSEAEMSGVYGRGLTEPTLSALGALGTPEQGGGTAPAAAADALSALGALSSDGAQGMARQLAQQRAQGTATSLQANLKVAQTLAALNGALAPLTGGLSLPLMPFPLLFTLPSLPGLDAIQKKH